MRWKRPLKLWLCHQHMLAPVEPFHAYIASSARTNPHHPFPTHSLPQDIIQQTPPSLRSKAARLVGAKCTLLARIDAYGQVGVGGACWHGWHPLILPCAVGCVCV